MRTPCELRMNTSDRQPVGASVMFLSLALLLSPGSVFAQGANPRLRATFNNPTPAAFDTFGTAVAALGTDRVLIGAEGAGEAYLFNLAGTLLTTFTNPTPSGDSFGATATAVGSDRVLIGAYNFAATYQGQLRQIGRAYLFATNGALLTTLTNPRPATVQAFGFAGVAALGSDHFLVAGLSDLNVGAPYSGGVFLFRTDGALLTTFTNPVPAAANGFGLGTAAFGNDRVLIGAPYANTGASAAGVAYLFRTNGALLTTFTNPAPVADDNFGQATAAVGQDRVLIGTSTPQAGAAYLFSTNGTLLATLTNPAPATSDYFGLAIAAVGNDQVLISSVWNHTGATDAGTAYLFALSNPSLSIAVSNALITVSWPSFPGFVLQQGTDLNLANWTTPQETITDNGATKSISVSPAPGNRFFRLFAP